MERQQVDAACRVAARSNRSRRSATNVGRGRRRTPPRARRAGRGRPGGPAPARRACRAALDPARIDARRAHRLGGGAPSARAAGRAAARHRGRAATRPGTECARRAAACSKSVSRAFVRARIAASSSGQSSARIARDERCVLVLLGRVRPDDGSGPSGRDGAQRLLGAAEARDEPVRELEHLRRRAVVLLEPEDLRVREPVRHPEQVLRAGAGERVDRLVVVADDAEVVAVAEPEVEQRLLQEVDVLVLVDGERVVLRAERLARPASSSKS